MQKFTGWHVAIKFSSLRLSFFQVAKLLALSTFVQNYEVHLWVYLSQPEVEQTDPSQYFAISRTQRVVCTWSADCARKQIDTLVTTRYPRARCCACAHPRDKNEFVFSRVFDHRNKSTAEIIVFVSSIFLYLKKILSGIFRSVEKNRLFTLIKHLYCSYKSKNLKTKSIWFTESTRNKRNKQTNK